MSVLRDQAPRASWPLLLALVLACGGTENKSESPGSNGNSEAKQQPSLRERMHTHFVHLSKAQTAVIEGRLDLAKKASAVVWPEARPNELPADWQPYIESLKSGVKLIENATELETAAMAVSAIGRACGDCHQAFGISTLGAEEKRENPAPESLGDYMRLHQWAADRLWEGIVGPSDESWSAGANALSQAKLSSAKIPEHILVKPGMKQLVERVGSFADAASQPGIGGPEKQRLYGEFLGSCARCHKTFLEGVD